MNEIYLKQTSTDKNLLQSAEFTLHCRILANAIEFLPRDAMDAMDTT